MAGTTTYDIKLNYTMGGDAARGMDMLAQKAEHASKSTEMLKHALLGVGAALGVHSLFEKGKEAFVGFNNEMQQLRISLGAIIQMNLGGTFEGAKAQANDLFNEFQRFSQVTPLTTKQIAEFGKNISAAVFTSGGNMKDFVNLTEQGAVAAKVFGMNAEFAGVEMQHLLAGDISSRMRFITALMTPTLARHGMAREDFKSLDAKSRMSLIKEALNDPGLKNALRDFQHSFEGVTSTFQDKIQIALGKVGAPLFQKITQEIERWNTWLEQNDKMVEDIGKKVSDFLVTGFEMVKSAVKFIVDHKDELILIAKMWALVKVGNFAAGALGSLGSAVTGFIGPFMTGMRQAATSTGLLTQAMEGVPGAFSQLTANIGIVTTALAGLYMGLQYIANEIDKEHARKITADAEKKGQLDVTERLLLKGKHGEETAVFGMARRFGSITKSGELDVNHFRQQLGYLGELDKHKLDMLVASAVAAVGSIPLMQRFHALGYDATPDVASPSSQNIKKDRDINVRIDKIEVASDDPDRFAFGLVHTFENMVKNPTSAASVPHGML